MEPLATDAGTPIRIYTIGHSNHTIEVFLSLLDAFAVRSVVDVRRYPFSGRFPHFDQESVEQTCLRHGKTYHWLEDLGGRRKGLGDRSPNLGVRNPDYRGYADHMLTDAFRHAAAEAAGIARVRTTALMCAEKDPQHCHRHLLSDYLVAQGLEVVHILDVCESVPHALSDRAQVTADGHVLYPLRRSHPDQGLLFDI